jgi:hypothetical protein
MTDIYFFMLQVNLPVRRHTSSSSEESARTVPTSAKEYVESLHQNNKSTLIYGKNNVLVQPVRIVFVARVWVWGDRSCAALLLHAGAARTQHNQ